MQIKRRGFLGAAMAGAGVLAAPAVLGSGRPRVVVVGGGSGGATAARYLAMQSEGAIDVTLVEPSRAYYTCYFSNLALGGFWPFEDLRHSYATLAARHGINVVHDWAVGVDRDAQTVTLAGGHELPYDRLVLSPGIDFVEGAVPGWDIAAQTRMPHAYKPGTQTALLTAQVAEMREGGVFAMVAPPNPYRCPPGPYERISMVAHVLSERNPTAKILLIDPKEAFSKQALFEEGWARHYPGMIERIGPEFGADNVSVDAEAMSVDIDGMVEEVDVCNVIPAQKAGRIAEVAGLTNDAGWVPVDPFTMKSRADAAIFVLGDASQQGDMPKSGYSANSQAKVAVNVIRHELLDTRLFPARYSNTCWSLIAPEDGVKVGASYEPTDEKIATQDSFISQTGEDEELRAATFRESIGWYRGITADMFS